MLRLVGRPGTGKEPRGVRVFAEGTGEAGLHAAKTECGGDGQADAGLPVPDGHRHLAAERPGRGTDGETLDHSERGREVLRHVFGVRTGTGRTPAHRGRGTEQPEGGHPAAAGRRVPPLRHKPGDDFVDAGGAELCDGPAGHHAPQGETASGGVRTECGNGLHPDGGQRGNLGGEQPRGQGLAAAQPEHRHGGAAQRLETEGAGGSVHRRGADGRKGIRRTPVWLQR